jgi:DNA primase
VEVPAHNFITHPDPEVCNAAVDLLTADDIYTLSKLWKKHDISVASERERLPDALPRAVILYKSKVIEELLATLRGRLAESERADSERSGNETAGELSSESSGERSGEPEDDPGDLLHQITALDRERTMIAKRLSRLIL